MKMHAVGNVGNVWCNLYIKTIRGIYVVCDQERDGVRYEGKSRWLFLKHTSIVQIVIYIFLKFEFY